MLELNPSVFGELYRVRADGSDTERLTHVLGYDGGPFFFPDGSDATRITDFGAMSWAPYVHPSGEYVLFASNKLGFANFEIYLVDTSGAKQPIRITHSDGFDGLPVPSPDGRQLAFTSNRHGDKGGQIYLAGWNHEAALRALAEAPLRGAEETVQ